MSSAKKVAAARVTFPLPGNSQAGKVVTTCNQQADTVLASPDIAAHPEVAAAANAVKTQAKAAGDIVGNISNTEAALEGLRTKRSDGVLLLRLLHGNMESLVNIAAAGDPAKAVTFGGKLVTRTTVAPSTDPPQKAFLKAVGDGSVEAKCQAEKGVICYLFQTGADPAHPEAWPMPTFSGGCKHTFTGFPPGQKAYVRIAIVRTGSVQGKWSDVMEVMVS